MKALHASSKNLKRALGLGLLGLMLSVPASQANAAITIVDNNVTDAFFIDSTSLDDPSENEMTVYETLSETDRAYYDAPYGNTNRVLGSTGSTYFDKVITFTNGTGPVTWTFEITNDTGRYWTDYHFEFWDETFTTPKGGLALIGATSDSFGNFHFADYNGGSILSFVPGGLKVGQADGVSSTYTMTGDLSLLADASGNGTFGLRQVATIVPEPGSLSLIGVGLAGLLGYRRKMRKA